MKNLGSSEYLKKNIDLTNGILLDLLEWILHNENLVLHSKPRAKGSYTDHVLTISHTT